MSAFKDFSFRDWMKEFYEELDCFLKLQSWIIVDDSSLKNGKILGEGFVISVLSGGVDQTIGISVEDKKSGKIWSMAETAKIPEVLQWMVQNRASSKSSKELLRWSVKYLIDGLKRSENFLFLYK